MRYEFWLILGGVLYGLFVLGLTEGGHGRGSQ